MKKLLASSVMAILLSSGIAFAQKETVYISPNNDGVQDELAVPLQIKEKRYVTAWSFVIENEKGEVVRTIGNKEKRPSRITFKSFWKSLITPKAGVDIPKSVTWNGVMDNGEIAPDGNYFYYVTASDDNGNTAKTRKLAVTVDNTPPEVTLAQPGANEKIFGEGAKTVFNITQSGSTEDLWEAAFTNADGKVVRSYKWNSASPSNIEWNGTDDVGAPLPDGVYNYQITARDKAGNVAPVTGITNIIYSAEKPSTNITILGSRYFSGFGDFTNINFDVKIPLPDSRSGNKLTNWKVEIFSKDGNVVRTYSGTDQPKEKIVFTGKGDDGKLLPDGIYQARVSAKYLNGYVPEIINSPEFVLDTVKPTATLGSKSKEEILILNPGAEEKSSVTITQSIPKIKETESPINNWTGKILDSNRKVVKEFSFGAYPPETVTWDGLDSSNNFVSDGTYSYVLTASDFAGNSNEIAFGGKIKLDTAQTELILSAKQNAFNPAATDGARSTLVLTPNAKGGATINKYELSIMNAETGEEVWNTKQSGSLPSSFTWNGNDSTGKRVADGKYKALLTTEATNGTKPEASSRVFVVDTSVPTIKVSADNTLFSPDGDGKKDRVAFKVDSSKEEAWTASIYDNAGKVVRAYNWQGTVPSFSWDGTDDAGNKLDDGKYRIVFTSTDVAGNSATTEIPNLTIDKRETKAFVTAEESAFSPNGDGFKETQEFKIKTTLNEGIEKWSFDIVSPEGKIVKQWTQAESKTVPATIKWDGKGTDGKTAEGVFTGKLKITYEKGNEVDVSSSTFICSVTPPELLVKTSPQYFSPDNDGENDDLFISLKANCHALTPKSWSFQIKDPYGKPFWSTSGKTAITERIVWDGRSNSGELVQSAMDYPYVFTVTDTLGMTSTVEGKIEIDILVIRDGDKLKMAVPSIVFRSDAADFCLNGEKDAKGHVVSNSKVTKEQQANNERILKRIAQVLKKFKDYTVTVEGHANNTENTEKERTSSIPLSKDRAEFVKSKLIKYGVAKNRLSTVGMGGTKPVASVEDKDNWWKNRRVEFILNK